MGKALEREAATRPPTLSAAEIPADAFADMRKANLARWPTGA